MEPLGEGDWARTLGMRHGSHTAFSIVGNLGKRSISVDLKTEAGKRVLWRLIKGADVFVEGFRPGVIKRLGFDYETVAAAEPRLLYLSISGFGQTGPLAERPATDPVLQAYTGLMNENRGEDGIPHRVPVIAIDMATALYAFQAVSAALYARRSEVRGRYIDISLLQAAAALQSVNLIACQLEGGTIRPAAALRIADGWMTVVVINERDWQKLCAAVEIPGLADDPRFAEPVSRLANRDALMVILRKAFAAEPWPVWNGRLTRVELLHERLHSYSEFIDQPHVKDTGVFQWSRQAGLEAAVPVPALPGLPRREDGILHADAPVPGQHTRKVLAEHGYDQTEIETLIGEGTVSAA